MINDIINKYSNKNNNKINNNYGIQKVIELNLDNISVIKIDVEGFELEVLTGALETIRKNKPVIILEIWPDNKEKYLTWFTNNLPEYDIESLNGWDWLLKPKN